MRTPSPVIALALLAASCSSSGSPIDPLADRKFGFSGPVLDVSRFAPAQLPSISPSPISGQVDDIATPGGDVLAVNLTCTAGPGICVATGFQGCRAGRLLYVANASTAASADITIPDDSAFSMPADRVLQGGADVVLSPGRTEILWCDGAAGEWRQFAAGRSALVSKAGLKTQLVTDSGSLYDYPLLPDTELLAWNGTAASSFKGFTGGYDGRVLFITNLSPTYNLNLAGGDGGTAIGTQLCVVDIPTPLALQQSDYGKGAGGGAVLVYYAGCWRQLAEAFQGFNSRNVSGTVNLIGEATIDTSHGVAPSLTSCGAGATVKGSNSGGLVTTVGAATGCTITFATPVQWAGPPRCNVQTETISTLQSYQVFSDHISVTFSGSTTAVIHYSCNKVQ